MTTESHQFDFHGLRWADDPPAPPLEDLAAWIDHPEPDDAVESALAADADLRAFVADVRLASALDADIEVNRDTLRRVQSLVPSRPSVVARIGGWAVAAAAAVLLAVGGWRLGAESASIADVRASSLSVATFGVGETDGDTSFLAWNERTLP